MPVAKVPWTSGSGRIKCTDAGSDKVQCTSWHWRVLTIHGFSGLSWVHFAKRKTQNQRLDSREHQNGPASEPVACKVNMESRSELCLCKTILTHRSEFLMAQTSWSRIWSGNLRNEVRRICVKIECRWFWKPIKGQSITTKTNFCRLIHKNYTHWEKNMDRCWTQDCSFDYTVSKKHHSSWSVVYLEKKMERSNSGD